MGYEHTQRAPLYLILLASASLVGGLAIAIPDARAAGILLAVACVHVLLALCFRELTVEDQGDRLRIAFGPIPLFRRHLEYAKLCSVQVSRTTLLDGWGVHWKPGKGWTWNLWGFDCVELQLASGRTLRVGTDEPMELAEFLRARIPSR